LPQLFSYGQVYRKHVASRLGRTGPPGPLEGTWLEGGRLDRALELARRLERVAPTSPSRIEIVVRDHNDPTRRYFTAFERAFLQWNLVEVRLLPRQAAATPALPPSAVPATSDNEP
jgi:hypothetical protein